MTTVSPPSDNLSKLRRWCVSHRIQIDPRLAIVQDSRTGAITVHNKSDEFILDSTTLVTIPKSSILSLRTCSLSKTLMDAIESRGATIPAYGHEAKLTLALVVYSELLLGSSSRWQDYLGSLPQETVPIALFWGYRYDNEAGPDVGSLEARTVVVGTEIERACRNQETGVDMLCEIEDFYQTAVSPVLQRAGLAVGLKGFHHAYSLVSSRAFLVDAYHGLSMVPIADAFNHTQENHVHLESDYHVCSTCGSVDECQHDMGSLRVQQLVCEDYGSDEDADRDDYGYDDDNNNNDSETCEMVTNCMIPPGSEVFNTYGEQLTNAELLVQYGFMLDEDGNENDVVIFDYEDLEASLRGQVKLVEKQVIMKCIAKWGHDSIWDDTAQPVYNIRTARDTVGQWRLELKIDVEGKLSHDLWAFCALSCMAEEDLEDVGGVVEELKKIAYRTIQEGDEICDGLATGQSEVGYGIGRERVGKEGRDMPECYHDTEGEEDNGKQLSDDELPFAVSVHPGYILRAVCAWRKGRMVHVEEEEEVDGLRRMVMLQQMSERRILDTACARFSDAPNCGQCQSRSGGGGGGDKGRVRRWSARNVSCGQSYGG